MTSPARQTYTPLERVLTALAFKEADRVPFFLLLTTHGARELGMSIRDYFADPEAVAEGQIRMQQRYGHDCLYAFSYAALEHAAWGGDVIFSDDGPPNAGKPLVMKASDIDGLRAPDIASAAVLQPNLEAIRILKRRVGDYVPIIAVVMSPFSVPVMQLGFEAYLDLIHDDRERFWRLMALNEDFCVRWANAQLAAGATAICFFDPVSSPDIVPPHLYRQTGQLIATRTIAAIQSPTVVHLASGRALGITDLIAGTGTVGLGLSTLDDLAEAKRTCAGKLSLLGNLNGLTMRYWTPAETEAEVKQAIMKGGPGGGFILSDNHGEIHHSVPESVLDSIAAAVRTWGNYPLDWIG
jgi:uroporphyrinogen decarboxylase